MNTPYGFKYQFSLVASAIIRTKLLFGALFLQGYFLFVGCSSPLNEIEVEDFNLIRAFVSVVKEISSDGAVKDYINLWAEDSEKKSSYHSVSTNPILLHQWCQSKNIQIN